MDLFDVARSCIRRWYVFLPLLAVVAGYSHSIYNSAIPVYYSQAVIGLAPPSDKIYDYEPGVPQARNGLIDIGGAQLVANLTAMGLKQPSVVDRVVAAGGLPSYDSKMFPVPGNMQQMPLIMLEITDPNQAEVSKTLDLVISQAEVTLRTLQKQAQVPDSEMVTPFVVAPATPPAAAMPSRMRSTIATFVAGAGLSILLTVLFDVFMNRRRYRAEQRRLEGASVGKEPDPASTLSDADQPAEAAVAPGPTDPPSDNHKPSESAVQGVMGAG
jgi:hypothetical protein